MTNYINAIGHNCKGNSIARQVKTLKRYNNDKLYNCCKYPFPMSIGFAGAFAATGDIKNMIGGIVSALSIGPIVAYFDTIPERNCIKKLKPMYKKIVTRAKKIYKKQ